MTILFVIESDPEASHRPAEAVRIAAGLGAWGALTVRVYLAEPAVRMLDEEASELVDASLIAEYLPTLEEYGQSIFVPAGSAMLQELKSPMVAYRAILTRELAALSAQSTYLLHF